MSKTLIYSTGIISLLAVVSYFSPWTFGATRTALGIYLPAFFWFLFAWIFVLVHIGAAIVMKVKGKEEWKHHAVSAGMGILAYIIVGTGVMNGYSVTV